MTKQTLIAIGRYRDQDRDAMAEAYDLHAVGDIAALADLPAEVRRKARALAQTGHAQIGAAEMDCLPALGLIALYGVGFDAIDLAAAKKRGIDVTNTPGVLNDDVADFAVALLLAQSRQIVEGAAHVRNGDWRDGAMALNRKVSGGRAGILGLGRIGREIADRLAAFKMEIHYHARAPKDVPESWRFHADPVALAEAVDFLFVALVGGPDTEGYVSREVIAALGHDGVLINISRGSTIDETALLEALESGGIRAAALDVFNDEPTIDPRFAALANVLPQPHQASATIETREAMGQHQRKNIAAFFAGEALLSPVSPQV